MNLPFFLNLGVLVSIPLFIINANCSNQSTSQNIAGTRIPVASSHSSNKISKESSFQPNPTLDAIINLCEGSLSELYRKVEEAEKKVPSIKPFMEKIATVSSNFLKGIVSTVDEMRKYFESFTDYQPGIATHYNIHYEFPPTNLDSTKIKEIIREPTPIDLKNAESKPVQNANYTSQSNISNINQKSVTPKVASKFQGEIPQKSNTQIPKFL